MSMSAAMLPEFDQEMANTRRALERIPEEQFAWKPHEKSYSLRELANHLARIPGWGSATLRADSMDLDPEKGEFVPPPVADTVDGVLTAFDEAVAEFRAALEAVSDEEMMKVWTLQNAGQTLLAMPRVAVMRGMIMNHMVHHRGQLTVYLRLNGVPVPALYGPSADEGGR
jgi:uncharacterized damage-inducible protein DinB